MTKALVLLSGGIDSTTLLAKAIEENDEVEAISFKYGATHEAQEVAAAFAVALYYQVAAAAIDLPSSIFSGGDSALLGEAEMPEVSYETLDEGGPSPTVVPFRNAVLLSMATALAAARGFDFVYTGNHASDWGGWAYPDCSPEFLGPFSAAVYVGTYHKVRLRAPFQWMTKAEIVRLAAELRVPLKLTWSCYDPQIEHASSPKIIIYRHCGVCPTCFERKKAFKDSGVSDPTEYAK